jgi:hypothetical protein
VQRFFTIVFLVLCCAVFAGAARADTFHLTDGKTVSGETTSPDDTGIILKQPDGTYSERIAWGKFTQDDLKLLAQNPRIAQFAQPFIEPSQEEKLERTQVDIKPVDRLQRPAGKSLLGAMASSSMGLFLLLIMYAANVYAGYEISVYRARPAVLVCVVAAVAPVIGPVIFLALPPDTKKKVADWSTQEEQLPAEAVAETAQAPAPGLPQEQAPEGSPAQSAARSKTTTGNLPGGKTFARGQFTFNRRFFETQMPGFFAVSRPEADKDKVLIVKSSRGNFEAKRIPRISATDINLQVQKGGASEEIIIPFVEIQEVQIRQKAH